MTQIVYECPKCGKSITMFVKTISVTCYCGKQMKIAPTYATNAS